MGEEADRLIDEGFEYYGGSYSGRFRREFSRATCKYCGEEGLSWKYLEGPDWEGMRLVDEDEEIHDCPERAGKRQRTDPSEDFSPRQGLQVPPQATDYPVGDLRDVL